jgi:hypothetical protein
MIQHIPKRKRRDVFTVSPSPDLENAAGKIVEHGVDAPISVRENIQMIAPHGERAPMMPVSQAMRNRRPAVEPIDGLAEIGPHQSNGLSPGAGRALNPRRYNVVPSRKEIASC